MQQPSQTGSTQVVDRILVDDGDLKVFMREPEEVAAWRKKFLRRLALLQRVYIESYERKLPPLEQRSNHQLHAFMDYSARVHAMIVRLAMRVDMWTMDWKEAIDETSPLSYEQCYEEVMTKF